MRCTPMLLVMAFVFAAPADTPAQEQAKPVIATHSVIRKTPDGIEQLVRFRDRDSMRPIGDVPTMKPVASVRAMTLPIDWAKNFSFPMYLNDQLGDCYYAAGCHADNTWTANGLGVKSDFALAAIKTRYFALSGGDNGLGDSDMQGEMKGRYLADVSAAKIVDFMYVPINDTSACQEAIWETGCVIFTFSVPSSWMNMKPGSVWDANTFQRNNNGHAVIWNGVDVKGNYNLQTWGTQYWITPAGVKACAPQGWIAFSVRWFNAKGYAANGKHITETAAWWVQRGGKAIPTAVINSFPPPGGPTPTPPPAGQDNVTVIISQGGKTTTTVLPLAAGGGTTVPAAVPAEIIKFLNDVYGKNKPVSTIVDLPDSWTVKQRADWLSDYQRVIDRAKPAPARSPEITERVERIGARLESVEKKLSDLPTVP